MMKVDGKRATKKSTKFPSDDFTSGGEFDDAVPSSSVIDLVGEAPSP